MGSVHCVAHDQSITMTYTIAITTITITYYIGLVEQWCG